MYRSPDAGIRYGSIDVAADVNVRAYLVCEEAGGTRYRKIRNAKVLRDLKYVNTRINHVSQVDIMVYLY